MENSPFTTHGDETLEARIVSWVLGEASAFEAAELERLCGERPELMVFKRRMRALHGLLTEAEKQQPDEGWRLPEEKRRALDELFGEPAVVRIEAGREQRVKHSGRRALLAIAACVVLTLVVLSLLPGDYEAATRIEIKPSAGGMSPMGMMMSETSGANRMTPQLFGTEFEKIKSRNNLEKVVENLDLTSRWGVDKETAIARLKGSVEAKNIRSTDLVEIRAREKDPALAKEIANEVTKGYKAYLDEIEQRHAEQQLAELNKAVRDQEDKVEERRKVLATIVRTKGIIYRGQDSFYGQSGVDEDLGAKTALQVAEEMKQEKMQLESQIGSLAKYDDDKLMDYAAGLNLPDNILRSQYPLYLDAKRQLDGHRANGLADNHPTVIAAKDQITKMKADLDESVVNMRGTLKAQLDLANQRLKSVEAVRDETREGAIRKGLDAQDYVDARRDFERDQELLQQMKLKKTGEEIALRIPRETVEVHDAPMVSLSRNPVRAAAEKLGGLFAGKETELAASGRAQKMVEAMPAPRGMIRDGRADAAPAPGPMVADAKARPTNAPAKPSSAMAGEAAPSEVMASDVIAGAMVPAAEEKAEVTSLALADDFGGGAGGAPIGGFKDNQKNQVRVESRTGKAGTAYLSESNGKPEARQDKGASSMAAASGRSRGESGAVPMIGELPVVGRLFSGGEAFSVTPDTSSDANSNADLARREMVPRQSGVAEGEGKNSAPFSAAAQTAQITSGTMLEVPRITTRSGPADEKLYEADEKRRMGEYDEARKLLEEGLALEPGNTYIQNQLKNLDDPIRANPALTYEHRQNVDKVRRDLYAAEGKYNLGKYDEAKRDYDNVLRTDPSNKAARRGLGKLEAAKSDYYRAAYDHTRAELLAEVDKSWELAVPADKATDADESKVEAFYAKSSDQQWFNASATDVNSWSSLAQRELIRRRISAEADGLRKQIEDPAIADSKKQAIFKEWNEKQKALATLDEKKGETDSELDTGAKAESSLLVSEFSIPQESDAQHSLVDLMQEGPAAEEPFSTFSLNISDASFQVAQAALAKGGRPDPAGVKVEQFYNAVDYGDPAPANGEPVAVRIEQAAHPVIPGRNLVRIALKTAAAGRSAAQPLRLTLLVDQSGSMSREDRRAAMDKALSGLGGLLTGNDLVTVIGFSRTPRLLADGMTGDKANTLPQLINQTASEGGTNLEQAIGLAAQLAERRKQQGAQNRIVLFTDGAANLGNADPEKLATRVRELRQRGIAFDIAGIVADGLNDELLGELARNGNGRYYVVGKGGEDSAFAKQLAGAFRPAAENVKVQVRFNPERVARYKLIGFEKDRLKTEDFRNDAVDAAELAAEEAGVAVYQVEPIANGRGEIGEVSVRFRDTSAAAMVERSWTITHDADAPAIDRAAPSMQLATLAMLAAEKLRGGPMADAIDFRQLATPAANVKQHYGAQGRPAEVLRMVDALK
jgi:capsular polysaccharide biosynthesis protein